MTNAELSPTVHLCPQLMTKAVQQFLRSLKIANQPFCFGAMFRRDLIELAPHMMEPVATIGSSSFGELKLLQIVG